MAEKTLNTRIILKHDELNAWESSSLVLKEGEVALAKFNTTNKNGISIPTYLMKVGDGSKTFSELNWLAAPASDVYAWAKLENPTVAELPANLKTAIQNLQTAISDGGSVSEAIKAAIEALDVTDSAVSKQFVTAVSQADGKIEVTRAELTADDIPALAISKITNLQTTLDAKAAKADLDDLTAKVGTIESDLSAETANRESADDALGKRIDTLTSTVETNRTTAASEAKAAKDAADAAQKDVDALETEVETLTQTVTKNKTDLEAAIAAEEEARTSADSQINNKITTMQEQITALNAATTLAGVDVLAKRPESANPGDIFVATDNNKEYIWDGAKWVELGDTTAEAARISALEGDMTTAKGDISSIKTNYATKAELASEVEDLESAIALKADTTTVNNINSQVTTNKNDIGSLKTQVGNLETTVGNESSGLVKQVNTNVADIASLKETVATKADSATVTSLTTRVGTAEGKITALEGKVSTAEATINSHTSSIEEITTTLSGKANTADLTAATERISAIEKDYLKAADTYIFDCGGAS